MSAALHVGVVTFPGSNGDHDALSSLEQDLGYDVRAIDYRESQLGEIDAVVLPGGFSYGDALRCGAIARFSPIMGAVRSFAEAGGAVLGICNGFQVLCEAHLLPGALVRNASLRFHCFSVQIVIENTDTPWTKGMSVNTVLTLPVAHGEGAYHIDADGLAMLHAHRQIVARYSDRDGNVVAAANRNGSVDNIAAICNEGRNVVGMMPHPERATNALIGGTNGLQILRSLMADREPAKAS